MTKLIVLFTACSLALSGAAFADSYKLDSKNKCRDDHGRFAKQMLCEQHAYKLDAKGKCHDEHGKFAAGNFCHA